MRVRASERERRNGQPAGILCCDKIITEKNLRVCVCVKRESVGEQTHKLSQMCAGTVYICSSNCVCEQVVVLAKLNVTVHCG